MWVIGLVIVELLAVSMFSTYMIWYYARKNVEWFTKAFVFVAWFFGFAIIVLLPYDVYAHNQDYSEDALHFIWRLNYWIAFLL